MFSEDLLGLLSNQLEEELCLEHVDLKTFLREELQEELSDDKCFLHPQSGVYRNTQDEIVCVGSNQR